MPHRVAHPRQYLTRMGDKLDQASLDKIFGLAEVRVLRVRTLHANRAAGGQLRLVGVRDLCQAADPGQVTACLCGV